MKRDGGDSGGDMQAGRRARPALSSLERDEHKGGGVPWIDPDGQSYEIAAAGNGVGRSWLFHLALSEQGGAPDRTLVVSHERGEWRIMDQRIADGRISESEMARGEQARQIATELRESMPGWYFFTLDIPNPELADTRWEHDPRRER